jgi:hypothetical protein
MADPQHGQHGQHEIPTHLDVEEKVLPGLTVRQAAYLLIGATGAFVVWQQWVGPPAGLRLGLATVCLAVAAALALGRRHGRGLDEWLFVVLRYATVRRRSVWRPPEPDACARRPDASPWAELAPRLGWPGAAGAAGAGPAPAAPAGGRSSAAGAARSGAEPGPPARRRPGSVQTAHLGLEAVDGDTLRLAGGRQRAVLRVDGLQLHLRDAADQEALLVAFAAFLDGLTFPVQFLTRVVPFDGEAYLERLERAVRGGPEALATVARDHAAFVRRLGRDGALLERRTYLVVPAPDLAPDDATAATGPWWPGGRRGPGRDDGWPFRWLGGRRRDARRSREGPWDSRGADQPGLDAARRGLAARCAEVERGLARCGLTARRLDGGELVGLHYACWCPELSRLQRLPPGPPSHAALVVRGPGRGDSRPGPGDPPEELGEPEGPDARDEEEAS